MRDEHRGASDLVFAPLTYTRDELVEEADLLVGPSAADWLEEQPNTSFEQIVLDVADKVWYGGSYLAALEESILNAWVAATHERWPDPSKPHPEPSRRSRRRQQSDPSDLTDCNDI